ncbi:MAG: hypothetical protein V3V20_09540 [Algisphaera sp.]
MIGQLIYSADGSEISVTLSDDLVWESADADALRDVRDAFPLEPDPELPNLLIGRHVLYQAAERLNGRVSLPPLPRRDPISA